MPLGIMGVPVELIMLLHDGCTSHAEMGSLDQEKVVLTAIVSEHSNLGKPQSSGQLNNFAVIFATIS